jgi:hypothetical protein
MLGRRRDRLGAGEQCCVAFGGAAPLPSHEQQGQRRDRDGHGRQQQPEACAARVTGGGLFSGGHRRAGGHGRLRCSGLRCSGLGRGGRRNGGWCGRRGLGSRCRRLVAGGAIAEHDDAFFRPDCLHRAAGLARWIGAVDNVGTWRVACRGCLRQGACVQHGISPVRKASVHGTLRLVQRGAMLPPTLHRQHAKWRGARTRRWESVSRAPAHAAPVGAGAGRPPPGRPRREGDLLRTIVAVAPSPRRAMRVVHTVSRTADMKAPPPVSPLGSQRVDRSASIAVSFAHVAALGSLQRPLLQLLSSRGSRLRSSRSPNIEARHDPHDRKRRGFSQPKILRFVIIAAGTTRASC